MAIDLQTLRQLESALSAVLYDESNRSRYDSGTTMAAMLVTTMQAIAGMAKENRTDADATGHAMLQLTEQFCQNLRDTAEDLYRERYSHNRH